MGLKGCRGHVGEKGVWSAYEVIRKVLVDWKVQAEVRARI